LKTFSTIEGVRRWRRRQSVPVALVPTMGALHSGHAALVDRARQLVGRRGQVVVSIFVNPTQFGPEEDFNAYPRPSREDASFCRGVLVDGLFRPPVHRMYAPDASITVQETTLSTGLCGATRPGHFEGVCTVVSKLFNILSPDFAVFGEKDYQQLAIIRRLARDLDFNVKVIGVPTVREPDGLAVSSRNRYLTDVDRERAPGIRASLVEAAERVRGGEKSAARLRQFIRRRLLLKVRGEIDYIEIVNPVTLQPVRRFDEPARLAVAVFLGGARLIDNIELKPPR